MIDTKNWLDIPGYEGMYQIRIDTNEVKSLCRVIPHKTSGNITVRERILKNSIQVNGGHLFVNLYKNGVSKNRKIHQIVMLIKEGPCPEGMEVCHNDGNPINNHPNNLRYGTKSDNMLDSVRHGTHHFLGKFGVKAIRSKKVYQFTKEGVFIREWGSTMDIERELGIFNTGISGCCLGKQKTAGGFIWKYNMVYIKK